MSEDNSIQVNFGRPMPLFPLESATLLPQQVMPLHIFEERYKQMVAHALDGSGQIAMAVYAMPPPARAKPLLSPHTITDHDADPPTPVRDTRARVRPAVCIGQIMQHERLDDGRYNLVLQGICRARVLQEMPSEPGRLYRLALVEPVGLDPGTVVITREDADESDETPKEFDASALEPEPLTEVRAKIDEMLSDGPLTQLVAAEPVLEFVRNEDVPTAPLLELVSFMLITDPSLRYRLLAEPSLQQRAGMIVGELEHLSSLIRRASGQHSDEWPKGLSWN